MRKTKLNFNGFQSLSICELPTDRTFKIMPFKKGFISSERVDSVNSRTLILAICIKLKWADAEGLITNSVTQK